MSVLVKPLVTEKISALNEEGRYGFVVAVKANKIQIKQAVEAMYGVTVEDCQYHEISREEKIPPKPNQE